MGKEKLVDKTIRPLTTLTNLTPSMVTGGRATNTLGNIPIGVYKGAAAFWDLDKAVNQPLVLSEQKYILGILDGREEDYDKQTLAVVALEAIGTAHMAQLTVPDGELWYVNTVIGYSPNPAGNAQIGYNWYCSLWTDRLGSLGYGQAFHGAEQLSGINAAQTVYDDFHTTGPLFDQYNRDVLLRLPPGTVLTAIFTSRTDEPANSISCTFRVFGAIGKVLVA